MPTSWPIRPAQYAEALASLLNRRAKKIESGLAMLKANYRSEGRVITATKLAKAAGYDNYGTGNEQYGSFAHELCKLLDFEPEQQRNGKPVWTYVICEPSVEKDTHGHFQWVLRDEVATALEELGVVRPTRVSNVLKDVEEKHEQLSSEPEVRREAIIQARLGQGMFRERLINLWEGCSVTGYANTDFLVACHIKPWRDCTPSEALDATNGLLLVPNLDRAFDRGFISFDVAGWIMLSPQLEENDQLKIGLSPEMQLRKLYPQHETFLQYHRESVFRSDS